MTNKHCNNIKTFLIILNSKPFLLPVLDSSKCSGLGTRLKINSILLFLLATSACLKLSPNL